MFEAKIENRKGEVLTLTQNESNYQIVSITGLTPPDGQINLSSVVGLDGAKYNSSKLSTRNIVLMIKINGNVEKNRQNLYRYCPTKEWCKFYYKNENRNVYIEGYIENCDGDLFSKSQIMQVSIICMQPYLKAMEQLINDISKSIANFEFPFAFGSNGATDINIPIDVLTDDAIEMSTIDLSKITNVYNDSESETGLIIQLEILSSVSKIEIKNTGTGETFILNYSFIEGDQVTINTNKGEKSISLLRNGTQTNIFSSLQKGSKFFQLTIGDNFFSYTIDNGSNDGSVHILFKHYTVYRGV